MQPPMVGVERSAAPVAAGRVGEPGARNAAPRTVVGVDGSPASVEALWWAAGQADLLVVGSRGHLALPGRLLGSVREHVAARASCPVGVVRHVPHPMAVGQRTHLSGREVMPGAGFR